MCLVKGMRIPFTPMSVFLPCLTTTQYNNMSSQRTAAQLRQVYGQMVTDPTNVAPAPLRSPRGVDWLVSGGGLPGREDACGQDTASRLPLRTCSLRTPNRTPPHKHPDHASCAAPEQGVFSHLHLQDTSHVLPGRRVVSLLPAHLALHTPRRHPRS